MTPALWLALALAAHGGAMAPACRYRPPLDDAEASQLLKQTPDALRVRPHALEVQPSSRPAPHTFAGALISRTPGDGALDNGLLGCFSVDRRTGEVTAMADFTTVHGPSLATARAALCRSRARR